MVCLDLENMLIFSERIFGEYIYWIIINGRS